jgi:hypothetical protein
LGRELDQRELDRLVLGERPAERLSLARVFDTLVDAVDGSAERACGLADAVLVDKHCASDRPRPDFAEQRILRARTRP